MSKERRYVSSADLEGKTIVSAVDLCVNCLKLTFSDASVLEIEVEHVGHGIYGMVTDGPSK